MAPGMEPEPCPNSEFLVLPLIFCVSRNSRVLGALNECVRDWPVCLLSGVDYGRLAKIWQGRAYPLIVGVREEKRLPVYASVGYLFGLVFPITIDKFQDIF